MRYLHLTYAVITFIAFLPFYVLGWCANEATCAYRMGFRQCVKYNSTTLINAINSIIRG